jgi:hypothetical protein
VTLTSAEYLESIPETTAAERAVADLVPIDAPRDDARAALERVRAAHPFRLVEIDIESDDALLRAYLERIPVVAVDGEIVSELMLDRDALLARLDTVGA